THESPMLQPVRLFYFGNLSSAAFSRHFIAQSQRTHAGQATSGGSKKTGSSPPRQAVRQKKRSKAAGYENQIGCRSRPCWLGELLWPESSTKCPFNRTD